VPKNPGKKASIAHSMQPDVSNFYSAEFREWDLIMNAGHEKETTGGGMCCRIYDSYL
jgi:hypothetical protein